MVSAGILCIPIVTAFFYWNNLLWCYIFGVLTISCFFLGCLIVMFIYIALSPKHQTGSGTLKTVAEIDAFHNLLMKGYAVKPLNPKKHARYPLVFTRMVDGALQNLLDLIFQDFVGLWLSELAFNSEQIVETMKQDVWGAIQSVHDRLSKVDHTKLVVCNIVNKITFHFEKIRIAQAASSEGEDPVFILSAHLMSPTSELDYLRRVSELYILFLLPRCYSLAPMKYLLREILACKILKPAIDLITDPDYINQKILSYIDQQQLTEAMHRKTYEYAESFEDFIRMIKSSKDLEVLKHIRYNIVTEIMQATTIQNVKRAQGLDPDNNAFGKSDGIQARKLKRYISQLTYAKNTCECHMQSLGWNGYPANDIPDSAEITGERVLPLQYILDNVIGRRYLSQFLEEVASQDLIRYWAAVQELRNADKSSWHQLGAEIFYTYITSPTAEIKVDRAIRKKMESFLLGDIGPNVFYEVQDSVVKTLEEKYYSSFVVSKQYKNMQQALLNERADDLVEDRRITNGTLSENVSLLVGEHSCYARSKLDQLQEKLNNKMQALQALKSSLKPESKVLNFLAKEVEWLQSEKRQLEAHLTHTEMWAEHLGHWRAEVQTAEIPDNGESPQFVLVVHMAEDEGNNDSICSGWVVLRKLQDFQDLHRKLRQLCSNVKNLDLPSQPLKFFGKSDRNTLDKAKIQIQKYLNFVLEDEKLNQSEALYTFLSPSSEHLKYAPPSPKKSRFSLSTLFKTSSNSSELRDKDDEEDYSLLLDDTDSTRSITDGCFSSNKDAIAEPLYTLLGEIFDLRGVFRWLRRSLITFVQITYGRTINRQIRDTISWVFSEPMLHYYIQLFTKSWWPNGHLVSGTVLRTDEEKLKTRGEARRQFLNNVPEVLTNLVGAQSAQRGAIKIFDSLQNMNLNKQLFYDMFEVVMYEVFPELTGIKQQLQ
ncbi:PREDICTED: sorting nexin-25 isoform X2 [Dufourea novaeangliae]|uniref:sorting nexin-25 isoform X2 n=1 Tax=Dufourea novaeangliae TaxID=178035 RepID=UPI000767C471|nr:PREDICTED: sorting nexin-25 isoform X2 [Dufourea novaeangliae]